MKRRYMPLLNDHLAHHRQMIVLAGPRQVGKTTLVQHLIDQHPPGHYLNYDHPQDRQRFTNDYQDLLKGIALEGLPQQKTCLALDELHKLKKWKDYLKGLFDTYEHQLQLIITGSARLDLMRRSGDSLMGRYFLYHIHPLSVAEIASPEEALEPTRMPKDIGEHWDALRMFGGFPEPLINQSIRFSQRWQQRKHQQLIFEDLASLTQIRELNQLDRLAAMLRTYSGQTLNLQNIAKLLSAQGRSIAQWVDALEMMSYGFRLKPWSSNVNRSLIKQPKWYLSDWSMVDDPGQRFETLVACHALKAVDYWNDAGLGNYDLYYVRDKEKREVDFLITRDLKPWILMEAQISGRQAISTALHHFHEQLQPEHSFQIAEDLPYLEADCFKVHHPVIVPARTLLSQLI